VENSISFLLSQPSDGCILLFCNSNADFNESTASKNSFEVKGKQQCGKLHASKREKKGEKNVLRSLMCTKKIHFSISFSVLVFMYPTYAKRLCKTYVLQYHSNHNRMNMQIKMI
jgi:hypothetical protein